MKNQAERQIGTNVYIITQFGALMGRKILVRLTRVLGGAMGGLVKGGFSGEAIGAAIQAFADTAREEDFDALCDAFAGATKVKRPIVATGAKEITVDLVKVFDDHFRGHYGEMILWLAFAIEVNYASFFGEIMNGAPDFAARLVAAEPAPEAEQKSG